MSIPNPTSSHLPAQHNFSQPASTQIELQPLPLSITRSHTTGTGSVKDRFYVEDLDLGRTASASKSRDGGGLGAGEGGIAEGQEDSGVTVQESTEGKYLEGGYGWLIVLSTFIIAFHFLGMVYSWGVIQSDLLNNGLATSRKLSVIGGLQAFCFAGFCIPASWIITRIGYKYAGILGILIDGIALVLCSFSTKSLGGLIFLQGIVVGCTSGLLFMTVYPLPSQYFLRKRGFATGITSCGGGLGGAAWSVIIQKLIEKVGLPWTYRILGLCTLAMCLPATFILRPGYKPPRPTSINNTPEPSIFRSSKFVRVLIACFIVSYPFFIPPFFIPQYAVSVGRSASDGALYSALYNIASGVGRLGFGILADVATGNLTAWGLSMLSILLSSFFVWPYATTSGGIIGFAFWCGLGSGGYFSLQSSISAQTAGSHRVAEAIGWIEFATCFGYLLGPITAGILLDAFGGPNQGAKPYKPSMYLVGATTTVALLLVISVRLSYTKKLFAKA